MRSFALATLAVVALVLSGCDKDTHYRCHGDGHVDCSGDRAICKSVTTQCGAKLKSLGQPDYKDPKFKAMPSAEKKRRGDITIAEGQVPKGKGETTGKGGGGVHVTHKVVFSKAEVAKLTKGKGGGVVGRILDIAWSVGAFGYVLLLGGIASIVYFRTHKTSNDGENSGDWSPQISHGGRTYYYNSKTGESTWTIPSQSSGAGRASSPRMSDMWADDWTLQIDEVSGKSYYFNFKTSQTSWTKPNSEAARIE